MTKNLLKTLKSNELPVLLLKKTSTDFCFKMSTFSIGLQKYELKKKKKLGGISKSNPVDILCRRATDMYREADK